MNQQLTPASQGNEAVVHNGGDAPVSFVQEINRAEIDQQIATAKAFPRNRSRVATGVVELATWSPEAASECNYALPRGGKSLTGPSIRLAAIVVAEFGNCMVASRVVHVDRFEGFVEAEAVFVDLETNARTKEVIRRSIKDRNGRLFKDDMILVAGNAACSIAKRNAVFRAVPQALWMPAYNAALQVIKGDAKTLTERRDGALKALGAFGVTPDMICGALEIEGVLDISLDDMPTMLAWYTALKDGVQTVEDLFPAPAGAKPAQAAVSTNAKLGAIAEEGKAKVAKEEPDPKAKTEAQTAKEEPQDEALPDPEAEQAATPEQVQAAFDEGQKARANGMKREACPPAYRDSQQLFDAWNEGWEAGGAS